MPLVFSTTAKEGTNHGIKVLVYGAPGVGKTLLCSTAPSPLIISAEAGLLTLRNKNIPVILVKSAKDVEDALNWCRTDARKNGIQTICLDSVSEIAERVLEDEKKKTKDGRAAYGELSTRTIQMVKDFRDIKGFNVLVTAKQTTIVDAVTGVVRYQPQSPGQQVGPALPYLFDEVFHMYTDKDQQGTEYWAMRTRASFNADAKDRSGVLDLIEYPDLSNIFNKINGAVPNA